MGKVKIHNIKYRMSIFTDLFGDCLIDKCDIKKAKTLKQLSDIIDRHHEHLLDRCNDAQANLDRFKKDLGLNNID